VDTAPKASGCILGGTREILVAVHADFLGGTGKAEDAKLLGAGIIPKQCPMQRVETEAMHRNVSKLRLRGPEAHGMRGRRVFPEAKPGKKSGRQRMTCSTQWDSNENLTRVNRQRGEFWCSVNLAEGLMLLASSENTDESMHMTASGVRYPIT